MKFQKNFLAFALLISTITIKAQEENIITKGLTEKQEEIITAVATAVVHGLATTVDQAIDALQPVKKITPEQARQLLQAILDNIEEGVTFELNDTRYVVADDKKAIFNNEEDAVTPADAE